jgi:pantoate--beta-alanine ligase
MRTWSRLCREDKLRLGLVPTMGALHEGHAALIRRAKTTCDRVVVSVFVNPLQFGPNEDYQRYPRDLMRDSVLAQQAGADVLFVPTPEEMLPAAADVRVTPPEVARRWEGEFRPGHFEGVCTICTRLFNVVQPDRAVFGRKDYQQLRVIEDMVAGLLLPVVIESAATVREPEGLALSSRNSYLSEEERSAALVIIRAMRAVEAALRSGERSGRVLTQMLTDHLRCEPMMKTQYAAITDPITLEPLEAVEREGVVLVAGHIGTTRLIDNLHLTDTAAAQ